MVITRLGEGVDETGMLSPSAVERTVGALRKYREVMEPYGVAGVAAAATSAVRDCGNGDEFLDLAADALGARPEILSGEEEARMSFTGAASDLGGLEEFEGAPVLVFDIGGGSTELIAGMTPPAGGEIHAASVDVGCVRMSERFLTTDPPSPVSIGRMESHLVMRLRPSLSRLLSGEKPAGIGLAGTVTTLSAIKQGLEEYDTDRIHHSRLTRSDVEELFVELASVDTEERKRAMGIEPGRADVIVGGTAVLRAVMDLAGLPEILISEKDILDGLVLEAYSKASFL